MARELEILSASRPVVRSKAAWARKVATLIFDTLVLIGTCIAILRDNAKLTVAQPLSKGESNCSRRATLNAERKNALG
jgi:hypothetical protein